MPVFPPDLPEALRSLQRQIDQANTARPGPMSWGPGDGHIRFYAADGRVLFQATSAGASIESRGALTGLTPLLDSIRAKDDDQDGRLGGHDTTLASHNTRISAAQSRADSAHANAATAQSRADSAYSRAGDALSAAGTAQSRADSAYTRAGTGIANAATAQSRADSAYSLADNAVTPGELSSALDGRPTAGEWQGMKNTVSSIETWLYNNTSYPQDGGGIPP